MVCPVRSCWPCCRSSSDVSKDENTPFNEPLVEAISQAVQTCLTVAKHTENAKIHNQKNSRHRVSCWQKMKRLLCCCCVAEEKAKGSLTDLGLWMQEHISSHGILVVGLAVQDSGVPWESILAGETLSPGEKCLLEEALINSGVKWAELMLQNWDNTLPGYGKSGGRFSPRAQEEVLTKFRESVGLGNLTDVLALQRFCKRC
ncbi:hypothetical protein [Chlamydia suis]|uniref:hypothetical protein n=1 Tax=Chlamydia suis TaxID=83559 RepID=UPI0009AF8B0C|nr:hypothetical protein [Chlamydia suis]QYC86771.1 hypothetical protein INQ98_02575 [Chlamydia suis]QYC87677.1 hypothetical protein INQ99_02595 [Chlamydia suis]QYC90366.1 hypothetical protein INQ01_02525 [Chlamydia suis]